MSQLLTTESEPEIEYPYSDGQPLGESVLQLEVDLFVCLQHIEYAHRDQDAFVGGDNFVYPVKGKPRRYCHGPRCICRV